SGTPAVRSTIRQPGGSSLKAASAALGDVNCSTGCALRSAMARTASPVAGSSVRIYTVGGPVTFDSSDKPAAAIPSHGPGVAPWCQRAADASRFIDALNCSLLVIANFYPAS